MKLLPRTRKVTMIGSTTSVASREALSRMRVRSSAVEEACLEAYRPGVTSRDVQAHVAEVLKRKGLDGRGQTGGIGHYVGLSVHDVGPREVPLREGMVFAIEPGLYDPEKNLGVRVEDTVLITKDGCEVLTAGVPKSIEDIERLLARRKTVSK